MQPADFFKAIHQLADLLLGPADGREEYVKRHYNNHMGINGNDPNSRIQFFHQLLNNYMNQEETYLSVYSLCRIIPISNASYYERRCVDMTRNIRSKLRKEKDWETVLKILSRSPLLADKDYFDTIPNTLADQGCIFGMVVKYIRDMPDDKRPAFIKQLQALPKRFGHSLLLELVNDNSQSVYTFISDHQAQFDIIDTDRLRGIESLLSEFAPIDTATRDQLPPVTCAFIDQLATASKNKNEKYLKELLNATLTQEMSNDIYSVPFKYINAITPLLESDRDTAIKLLDKGISLVSQAKRNGRLNTGSSSIETWFFQRMIQEQRDENNRLSIISLVMSYAKEKNIDFDTQRTNFRHYLNQVWNHAYNQHRKDMPKAFTLFHSEMTKHFGTIDQSLVYETYFNASSRARKLKTVDELLKVFDTLLESNPKDSVATEIVWFLNFRKATLNNDKSTFATFCTQTLLPRLTDESINVSHRLELARRIIDQTSNLRDPRLVFAMANMIAQMAKDNKPIDNTNISQLFYNGLGDWARVDGWETAMCHVTEQLNPYMLRASRKSPNHQTSFPFRSDTMSRLMLVNHELGQDEINTQLARVCQQEHGRDARLWCLLLNLNQKDIALSWLNLHWSKMRPGRNNGRVNLKLDKTFQTQANALFESIDKPDLKSLAQVLVAMSPASNERKKTTITDAKLVLNFKQPRSQTAVELAKMILNVSYRSQQMQNNAIEHLIEEPQASQQLAEHITNLMKDANGLTLLTSNTSGDQDVEDKLWLGYLFNEMSKANTAPLEKYMAQCKTFAGNSHELYRAKSKITDAWRIAAGKDMWLDMNQEQLQKHLAVMRVFIAMKVQNDYLNNSEYCHALLICLDTAIQSQPDHATWYESLPEKIQTNTLRYRIDGSSFVNSIAPLMKNKHLFDSNKQRIDYLTRLAQLKPFGKFKMPPIRINKRTIASWFGVKQNELIGTIFTKFEYDDLVAILGHKPRPKQPEPKTESDATPAKDAQHVTRQPADTHTPQPVAAH